MNRRRAIAVLPDVMTEPAQRSAPAPGRAGMPLRRRLATVVGAGALLFAPVHATVHASPAQAHGAPVDPVSRTFACSPDGEHERSPACRAAIAAGGGTVGDWDNLRVSDVGGRDREVIPDGRLCSGGLRDFRGLDVARRDWPATTLVAGATFGFGYRSTIAHRGTFRLYVTRDGYDPGRPLRWSDLERRPFLEVTDPRLVEGSYAFRGRLPAGKSGRHVIYTIWQNSDTPDTYYSCSDVVFRARRAPSGTTSSGTSDAGASSSEPGGTRPGVGPGSGSGAGSPSPTTSSEPALARAGSAGTRAAGTSAIEAAPAGWQARARAGLGAAAGTLALAGAVAVTLRRRRRDT